MTHHDPGLWDRGTGELSPKQPSPRRISPQDFRPNPTSPTKKSDESKTRPANGSASAPPHGATPDPTCPRCKGAGHLVADAKYGDPAFGRLVRCGCLEATLVAARQAAQASRAARATARMGDELGKLSRCTFDSIDRQRPFTELVWRDQNYSIPHQRQMLMRACGLARQYEPCESLYLYGPPGSCKSHLAAAILNDHAAKGVEGRYGSMPAILRLLRRGFQDGTADERLEALMDAPLLVLDDLGTEHPGDWADTQLFDLLSVRIAADRATIITSNLPATAHLDGRIVSRLQGEFTAVPLILSDYRAIQAEQRSV